MRFIRHSKNNKDGLDSAFRDGLKNMRATPDPEMWDRINDELDADIKKKKYHHWYLAAILILLPITLTNVFVNYDLEEYYSSFQFSDEQASAQNKSELMGNLQILDLAPSSFWDIDNSTKHFSFEENSVNNPSGLNKSNTHSNSGNSGNGSNNGANYNTAQSKSALLANQNNDVRALDSEPILLASISADYIESNNSLFNVNASDFIPSKLLSDKEAFKANSKSAKRKELNELQEGIYLGASSGMQYNKLLRRENQFAPLFGDNVDFDARTAVTYGGRLGWNFNRFLALEAGVYKSKMEVHYLDNKYDKIFTEGIIAANYIEIPLNLKFKYTAFNGVNNLPHSFALTTGLSYARLTSSDFSFGEFNVINPSQYFDTHQLALNIGMEYEWFVHKNISLTAGGGASAFSSKEDFPKFSPKNASGDLRLNYQFQLGMNFLLPISK